MCEYVGCTSSATLVSFLKRNKGLIIDIIEPKTISKTSNKSNKRTTAHSGTKMKQSSWPLISTSTRANQAKPYVAPSPFPTEPAKRYQSLSSPLTTTPRLLLTPNLPALLMSVVHLLLNPSPVGSFQPISTGRSRRPI